MTTQVRESCRRIGPEMPPLLEAFFAQCQDPTLPPFSSKGPPYLGASPVSRREPP